MTGGIDLPQHAKVTMDAQTDQALMMAREYRGRLAEHGDELTAGIAEGMAAHLAAQFPGQAIGRIVMAVTQDLKAIEQALVEEEGGVSFNALILIAGLAAEQLDRETA